jgi:predicted dehydrogenase
MAIAYANVLQAQEIEFITIGRGKLSAQNFQENVGTTVISGGLNKFLTSNPEIPSKAIVAVSVEQLAETTTALIEYGINSILVEKPGGLNKKEIEEVAKLSSKKMAKVFVAYNRRFYSSVLKAQSIIHDDGGVNSFNFEFTEWGHVINSIKKAPNVKENWFFANSTHVVDLAFFLGGTPKEISCYTSGSLPWHTPAAAFAGAGKTDSGALFSYQANWSAPGRWTLEVLTTRHRLYLSPLEELKIQKIGSISVDDVELESELDQKFKPGLYRQVESFIADSNELYSIQEQAKAMRQYKSILGGIR